MGVAGLAVAVSCACALEAQAAAMRARIMSVSFTGTVANPTLTIVGTGFGSRPRPSPPYKPTPPKGTTPPYGCTATGNVGYDYGTSLWLADLVKAHVWSAGRYRPAINELDCVGLLMVSYTPTKAVFHLGVDYKVHHYQLTEGDPYQVAVSGAVKRGIVHYVRAS